MGDASARRESGAGRPGRGYRLLVALHRAVSRPARVRVAVLVVFGAVAAVLATWGWRIQSGQPDGDPSDPLTVTHGLWALFSAGGDIGPAPWPLAVARAMAPFVTVGFVVELALEAGATRVRHALARRSGGHLVVVAPPERAAPYLSGEPAGRSGGPALHVTSAPTGSTGTVVVVPDDGTAQSWLAATNAAAAARVVLATGSDARTLALLAAALDARMTGPAGTAPALLVEVDDRALALQVAVNVATADATADVEVVCMDDVRADFAARRLADAVARRLGFHGRLEARYQTEVIGAVETRPDLPLVAIVGDGPVTPALADHLGAELRALERLTSTRALTPLVVDGPAVAVGPAGTGEAAVAAVAAAAGARPVVAVVGYRDPDATARVALALASWRPDVDVWVVGEEALVPAAASPPAAGSSPAAGSPPAGGPSAPAGVAVASAWPTVQVLSHAVVGGDDLLAGPFIRAAQSQVDDLRARASAPDEETGPDGDAGAATTAWAPAQVRTAVATLHGLGWRVAPAGPGSVPPAGFPATVREALSDRDGAGLRHPDDLLRFLPRMGLAVSPPVGPGTVVLRPARPAGVVLDEAAVEAMARVVHRHYLDAAGGPDPSDEARPARRTWEDLGPSLRAQNRDQVRDNMSKVARLGLRVEPGPPGAGTPIDDQDAVEALARAEHDRWAAQRRDQGYRWGPDRFDKGRDRRHPDLLPWEELSDESRAKDSAPVARIPEVLAEAGYRLVPEGAGPG